MIGLVLGAALLATSVQEPQETAATAPDAPSTVEEVVVTAQSEKAVEAFVSEVSQETKSGRLARWNRKICVGVLGVEKKHAEYLIDRVSLAALAVGLDSDAPGCRPNVLVISAADAGALAAHLVEKHPHALEKYEDEGATRGRDALKDFVAAPRPVRWWHVTRQVNAEGERAGSDKSMRVRGVGRIRGTSREDFSRVLVVLDSKRLSGVKFQAVSDYVAMVALAQLDPEADTSGLPTILNVFADRDAGRVPAAGMTEWDVAYLQGLYGSKRDARNAREQQRAILRKMKESPSNGG